jgi:CrcB protein
MDKLISVAAGAAIGGVLRYLASMAILSVWTGRWPLGTFLVNISGSFAIGLLMTLFIDKYPHLHNWRLFLVTGVLGGYTTFSSFEWEALENARFGDHLTAGMYVFLSVVLGYIAAYGGVVAASRH